MYMHIKFEFFLSASTNSTANGNFANFANFEAAFNSVEKSGLFLYLIK